VVVGAALFDSLRGGTIPCWDPVLEVTGLFDICSKCRAGRVTWRHLLSSPKLRYRLTADTRTSLAIVLKLFLALEASKILR